MKRFFSILFLVALTIGACDPIISKVDPIKEGIFSFSGSKDAPKLEIGAAGGSLSLSFTAPDAWSAATDCKWLKITPPHKQC